MKGCPLRCVWCHNPEGLSPKPELLFNAKSCSGCGNCRTVCSLLSQSFLAQSFSDSSTKAAKNNADSEPNRSGAPTDCLACGRCAEVCPTKARRLCGRTISVDELTGELLRSADVFRLSPGGGVTFSGGEPLLQADFCAAVCARLRDEKIATAVETSGYAAPDAYQKLIGAVDLVLQDLKHPSDAEHRQWTGVSNRPILENLARLKNSDKPFIARIPLVPTVNDSPETLSAFAALLENAPNLLRVELLAYHGAGAAKFHLLGKEPPRPFKEKPVSDEVPKIFAGRKISCRVL